MDLLDIVSGTEKEHLRTEYVTKFFDAVILRSDGTIDQTEIVIRYPVCTYYKVNGVEKQTPYQTKTQEELWVAAACRAAYLAEPNGSIVALTIQQTEKKEIEESRITVDEALRTGDETHET